MNEHCLKNYIGLLGCEDPEPESGLYINSLPSIDLASIDGLASAEQLTYLKVWDDVQVRSLRQFNTKLTAYFKKKYKLNRLVDRFVFGRIARDIRIPAIADDVRGFLVNLAPYEGVTEGDQNIYTRISPMVSLSLDQIYFMPVEDGNYTFRIADADLGANMHTVTLAGTSGEWLKVFPSWETPAAECPRRLFVYVEADVHETIKTIIGREPEELGSGSDCGCGCVCLSDCCTADVRGAIYNVGTGEFDNSEPDNAHGFKGYVSLKCSYDSLICVNRDLFADALWYLLGKELMVERLHSSRINNWTTIDRDKAAELHDLFADRYDEAMQMAVDGIDLNDADCCITCDPVVASKTVLP